ncbi:Peptidoglycan/LPS O-acetylase OafA/YrhL, contains acyltransferase and SGNH-hydrolase domains [Duganella sp. CF517]|uniref:acyltransferase family protein n=1 Tax=Duganella sp. CF517 TaxID=1881038 RepID=UPI0008D56C40|nr:acyltransferase [Duganella sp. CF517]SEN48528.1 Peptidoglycan/LPS O-acetylase OafA/YrhL, contains acyltransferase and SGNH-hydrolase domains [Duganella sp. CF517]
MSKQSITSLQALRGLAALAVVFHHVLRAVTINRPADLHLPASPLLSHPILVDLGAMGVDLFFVLSGFLMIYISRPYQQGHKSTADFVANRLIRVWPLYAVVTVLLLCQAYYNTRAGGSGFDLTPMRLLSLFFVPSFNEAGVLQPILGVGWTLNYEVFFYLVFAAAILIERKHILAVAVVLVGGSYAIGALLPHGSVLRAFLFNSVILEFLLGATVASAYMRGALVAKHAYACLAAGLVVLAIFAPVPADEGFRLLTRGVPAALLFAFVLLSESKIRWPRAIILLGDASYSIYLVHVTVLYTVAPRAMGKLTRLGYPSVAAEGGAIAAMIACVAVGLLCHFLLEKPLTRCAKHIYLLARGPAPTASA